MSEPFIPTKAIILPDRPSQMTIKERASGKIKPLHAEGHVGLYLFDPITKKIVHEEKGKNHVFAEALLAGAGGDWVSRISQSWMLINDSAIAIDTDIPYLFGQNIAYGRPSVGTLGTFRGAYNAANQVLAQATIDKIRWKFQYDFTTAQGNSGTMRQIGLSRQYDNAFDGFNGTLLSLFPLPPNTAQSYSTCDGRYAYVCSTAGVITKYDLYLGTNSTIDVSAIVGTTTGDYKVVGYNPSNGKFMVVVMSNTSGNRKVHVFSDSSFSNKESTYSTSNTTLNSYSLSAAYFYENYVVILDSTTNIYKVDYVNNLAFVSSNLNASYGNALYNENSGNNNNVYAAAYSTCPIGTKYLFMGGGYYTGCKKGFLFNLETMDICGYIGNTSTRAVVKYPLTTEQIVSQCSGNGGIINTALTAYQLATPITKTTANGMTATYELEVYW